MISPSSDEEEEVEERVQYREDIVIHLTSSEDEAPNKEAQSPKRKEDDFEGQRHRRRTSRVPQTSRVFNRERSCSTTSSGASNRLMVKINPYLFSKYDSRIAFKNFHIPYFSFMACYYISRGT